MTRTPPTNIRKSLREEVNFGCPINGCRSPFLEYHHFSPKWSKGSTHRVTGMIALCPLHHRMADVDTWSVNELNSLKSKKYIDPASGQLQWNLSDTLFCLGSNYFLGDSFTIRLGNKVLINIASDEKNNALLSAELWNKQGDKCCLIDKNDILPQNGYINDLECTASANFISVKSSDLSSYIELYLSVKDVKELIKYTPRNISDSIRIYAERNKIHYIKQLRVKAKIYSPLVDIHISDKNLFLDFRKIGDKRSELYNTFWDNCNLHIRFKQTKIPIFHIGTAETHNRNFSFAHIIRRLLPFIA